NDPSERDTVKALIARIVAEEGQTLLGWRTVPTDDSSLGERARAVEPVFEQLFIAAGDSDVRRARLQPGRSGLPSVFERRLYIVRKRIEQETDALNLAQRSRFYVVSLSSKTLIYKGMLTAAQIRPMFTDLSDPRLESSMALVHQRFSTNTFPSWPLAH